MPVFSKTHTFASEKTTNDMAKIDTRCVHAGYKPGKGEPRQVPIIQSTTFKYETSDQMGKLFALEEAGYS